jgi:ribosome-associated heat shock protein Hsp15
VSGSLRIDKWLWHARFCRTRRLSRALAESGHIRLNGQRVEKPAIHVKADDVLTVPAGHEILVVRILGLGERRGSAPEARTLYEPVENA